MSIFLILQFCIINTEVVEQFQDQLKLECVESWVLELMDQTGQQEQAFLVNAYVNPLLQH